MKLYKFTYDDYGYDEYDGAVVIAKDEEEALALAIETEWEFAMNRKPSDYYMWFKNNENGYHFSEVCEVVGDIESRVLLESFNAG